MDAIVDEPKLKKWLKEGKKYYPTRNVND